MNRGMALFGAALLRRVGRSARRRKRRPARRAESGGRPGAQVRGRPDVAQADAESLDPRLGDRRRHRLARSRLRRPPDRQLHAAHRDRLGRGDPAGRRVLRLGAERARVRPERGRSSATGAARAKGYDWPTQNAGIAIDPTRATSGSAARAAPIREFSSSRRTASSSRSTASSGGARRRSPAAGRGRSAGDTAYAGVSPGQGAGGRGGGRGGRGGRGGAPALPAEQREHGELRRRDGLRVRRRANEVFVADGSRNRRVAVVDMNTGAIKRVFGRLRQRSRTTPMRPTYAPSGAASKQFGPVRCVEIAQRRTGLRLRSRRTTASRSSRRTARS